MWFYLQAISNALQNIFTWFPALIIYLNVSESMFLPLCALRVYLVLVFFMAIMLMVLNDWSKGIDMTAASSFSILMQN